MKKFQNKTAIITGAGTGIGFAIARQLAAQGAFIVLNDINENAAHKALNIIQKKDGICIKIVGDSSDINLIEKMISAAVKHFGKVDIIIANAGITTFGKFLDYTLEDFQRLVAVNLQGSFFLAQSAAQQMIQQKTPGRILFMSSVAGHQFHPNLAAYGMTKSALEMLTKNLAVELAQHQITVNAIAPGATITDRNLEHDPNYIAAWEKITPTGKVATIEDIANAALFFLLDSSSQITGQRLVIDGGWTAVSPPPE